MSSSGLKHKDFQFMKKDDKEQELSDGTDAAIAYEPLVPLVFCHVCGKAVKLTKDGRYRRHGYKRSYASRDYFGVPYQSGYSGKETKRPCWASGEFPLP